MLRTGSKTICFLVNCVNCVNIFLLHFASSSSYLCGDCRFLFPRVSLAVTRPASLHSIARYCWGLENSLPAYEGEEAVVYGAGWQVTRSRVVCDVSQVR